MQIFDKNGFLNVPEIAKIDAPFKILIGARQIGKTYGLSKYLVDNDKRFIYMRRQSSEIEFIVANDEDNPFMKVYRTENNTDYGMVFRKSGKYIYNIYNMMDEKQEYIKGIALSLTSVAKIRGFSADKYTDIFYDEFIPEKHVHKIAYEADALFNAYETINSNRELDGKKPVNLWLLANANNLNNPILSAMGLINHIEKMITKGQSFSYLQDRGIVIVYAQGSPISDRKRKTALYKAVRSEQFKNMALDNDFSYNDFSNIISQKLIEYKPLLVIDGITILIHKNTEKIYAINKALPCKYIYSNSDSDIRAAKMRFDSLFLYYIDNCFYFDSFDTKQRLLDIFGWSY